MQHKQGCLRARAVQQVVVKANTADLCCHTVLLHQGLLGEVDLQGVICAEAHIHPSGKEGGEWIAMIVQEQTVVGQRAHAQAYLCSHSR